ncbi:hypothetical protein NKI82_34645, partial [Mesorhizobium sp. M0482]
SPTKRQMTVGGRRFFGYLARGAPFGPDDTPGDVPRAFTGHSDHRRPAPVPDRAAGRRGSRADHEHPSGNVIELFEFKKD